MLWPGLTVERDDESPVGTPAFAWNFLHERLARLFIIVSGAERHIALAIWYSTDSDRTQQGMLRVAIEAGEDRWSERQKTISSG
jgi:hypothetical protein